jgi:molybdopterin/thiamine biosynthesis adenylyltransferase/proteasome lid subunit RPN8/RPN11
VTELSFSLTLRDEEAALLDSLLFAQTDLETAAYLMCGVSVGADEVRLLVREVVTVLPAHYLYRGAEGLSIDAESYVPVLKRARLRNEALVFVHTHPGGMLRFSSQDDSEEARFFATVRQRLPGKPCASLVLTEPGSFVGRVWLSNERSAAIQRIRVVGRRFRLWSNGQKTTETPSFYDRQVRAFGPEPQVVLQKLVVGVVGAGGTGSAVFEQLLRLGVGKLLVVDRDCFDRTNVNRVWGSRLSDESSPKIEIVQRTAKDVGLPAIVQGVRGSVLEPDVTRLLRSCDFIFCCTDTQLSRLVLGRLATRYLIPVLDLGVLIDSCDGQIRSVTGRVTRLFAGAACLLCRQRISPGALRAEGLPAQERQALAAEGYVPELDVPNPAVVPFTSAIASLAVADLLHTVTGFMGDRRSTETIVRFDRPDVRSNSLPPEANCDCADRNTWGRGDEEPFLGIVWPTQGCA